MTSAAEVVAAEILHFDEAMNRAGFRTAHNGEAPTEWAWEGQAGNPPEPVHIQLRASFPYAPPEVILPQRAGQHDWHLERDGKLCLWDRHAQGDLPWLEAACLRARIDEWIDNANHGWPEDAPQLDIEAYSPPKTITRGEKRIRPVVVIDQWSTVAGHWFTVRRPNVHGCVRVQTVSPPPPKPPKRQRGGPPHSKALLGVAVDLGELASPFFSITELFEVLGADSARVQEQTAAGRDVIVAARYHRMGQTGFTGFWFSADEREIRYESVVVIEEESSRQHRAGWHAATLAERTVTVIGAGSLGSYVTDILVRSGIGAVNLHDDDRLLPGNLVRHATPDAAVGEHKARAVATVLNERSGDHRVTAQSAVRSLDAAVGLLQRQDLVIDCTGDRLTHQLFQEAARLTGQRFLHVAVVGHGQYGRVDVCPPLDGTAPLPPDDLTELALTEFEGGCGDPISPTPPAAVVETAAMGARIAVQLLTGELVAPAGESRRLFEVAP